MSQDLEQIWSRVQAQLALVVDEPTYRIWLEPLRALELRGDAVLVAVPVHARHWIQERYGRAVQASIELVLGEGWRLELTEASEQPAREAGGEGRRRSGRGGGSREPDQPQRSHRGGPLGNPKLTFEQFVIGDSNRLAHAAALTVAEMPAQAYNPLFICGPPGVGKTHLLSSIANLLALHAPEMTVRATTGEAFTNEFLAALAGGEGERFKARFRDVDVLLLDDVQFLQRKTRTEEEFFHTFNALHDEGRQIVLTSDRPPHDLKALEDRLRERFAAGLIADVAPPDLPTRLAILRKRAHHDDVELAEERALEVIADRVATNVRALEGALIRVVAFSSLSGRPFTAGLAEEVLDGLYPRLHPAGTRARTVADVQAATCELFGLSSTELLSSSRSARVAWPRQMAMYLSREITGQSTTAIGRQFGGRDHTTVLHACKRASARLNSDEPSRRALQRLCTALGCDVPGAP
ncbi:MAG TPA: chromosomal replication initiator protein DnaA [Solirubrobacteraceae bacterium]|nr:chromosomal replication initiator protein DnaA [Solirubrobacteraceae bacterium]